QAAWAGAGGTCGGLNSAHVAQHVQCRFGEVERVEVQGGGAAGDQPLAHRGDELGGERAYRLRVVAVGQHALGDPARDLGAAGFGEAAQLGEVRDRHDPGHDRHLDPERARLVHEAEVGVGVVEVL